MANTTNFNWETPDDTDLVKDGAAAIRTLGSSIDTSLVDLKGGTTGQNLRKNTNTDMDFVWAGDATNTVVDAAGDLLYGSAADTLTRLGIGTAGQILRVNSGATAPEWATPAAGGDFTLINRTAFSNVANTGTTFDNVFTSAYKVYQIVFEGIYAATGADDLQMLLMYSPGTTQATNYYGGNIVYGSTSVTANQFSNTNEITINTNTGISGQGVFGYGYINNVGNSNQFAEYNFFTRSNNAGSIISFAGSTDVTARTYTGFQLKSSSSNITGTAAVYGLAD